ncbi:MAG TPA: SMC-Scp complex subunit ScpB [Lacipirellulaceae bacterium]|nr:SMC-Scp complex subunit ScpB [Lacipirellulaceae bacterium]
MLGSERSGNSTAAADADSPIRRDSKSSRHDAISSAACEINARSVAEALLFVGRPDNGAISAREMAGIMRGVSPGEIHAAVVELNASYDADMTPYKIESTNLGYRLVLRPEFERMRDKFYGRVREAKLSTAALEVLSIIAYNQPLSLEEINNLRGVPSGAVVSTLVRRQLVRLEHAGEPGGASRYWTTERFLRLFGLENLAALPRSEELERA